MGATNLDILLCREGLILGDSPTYLPFGVDEAVIRLELGMVGVFDDWGEQFPLMYVSERDGPDFHRKPPVPSGEDCRIIMPGELAKL